MIEFGVKSCPPFIKHEESTWRHLTYPSNSTSLRFPYFPSLPKARLAVVSDPPPPGQPLKSTHGVVSSPPFFPPSFPLWLNTTFWEDLFSLAAPLPCFPCIQNLGLENILESLSVPGVCWIISVYLDYLHRFASTRIYARDRFSPPLCLWNLPFLKIWEFHSLC